MKYIYQARTKEGKIETGTLEASSKEAAAILLQKYNIFITSIKEQTPSILRMENIRFLNKVSKKDLAIFSRQLAVMLQSRVAVVQSLKGLAAQTKNSSFREKILKISQLVEEGNSLSEAFATFPEIFNVFYVSLIKTGEASGKISESLYYLSDHLERESDISSKIKSAMIYPAFVICVLGVVILLVIYFVIPRLVDLLKQTVAKPPPFTLLMIGFYGFLTNYGWTVILAFFILIIFLVFYLRTKEGKKNYDKFSLRIPFIGGFLKKIFLINFAENISTLIGAGLSINMALKITKDTVENFVYKQIISETEERVSEGQKISSVLIKYPKYAPPFVVQMIQVGEETGRLDKNLMEIVNFYQKEVTRAIEIFTALLEPILIIFLGIIVALLAVSVLEPLYGSLSTI
jgi:type IV pilus assembly protein PilC